MFIAHARIVAFYATAGSLGGIYHQPCTHMFRSSNGIACSASSENGFACARFRQVLPYSSDLLPVLNSSPHAHLPIPLLINMDPLQKRTLINYLEYLIFFTALLSSYTTL